MPGLSQMKLRAIAVAPAAMSAGLLSKSNSTSSPIAVWAGAEATLKPELTTADQRTLSGVRLLPSTEIFERSPERTSQRTRIVAPMERAAVLSPLLNVEALRAVTGAVGLPAEHAAIAATLAKNAKMERFVFTSFSEEEGLLHPWARSTPSCRFSAST